MAGFPGGGSGPSGVPGFWAPHGVNANSTDTTTVLRQPTFVPTWRNWVPPGGTYGFVDYSIGISLPPDTTHILRAPTFTPTWQRYHIENLGFAQSVPLTLQPAAAAVPVFMPGVIVWSNPRAPQRSVDLLTVTQSLSARDLLPPFAQDDWPNPVRPRADIVPYWIAGTNLGLLRPDVNPFAQRDWPDPRGPQRGQDLVAGTNLGLLRPDVRPFAKLDWPNPVGPPARVDFIADTNQVLLRPDVNPFIPHDWANPRLALQPVADWLAQGIRAAVVVQAPFAQYDWPLPRGPINLSIYKFTDYISGIGVPVTPPDTTHIIRTPTFTPAWQQWQTRSYVNWADYYSIQIIPVQANYDWPNPVGPSLRHVGYQGWINYSMQSAAVVTPPDTTHILRAPVYTPRWEPRRSVNLYTLVNGVVGTGGVVPPAAPPFLPLDWPNPIRLADRGVYQKWSDYYSIQIIPPSTNYDQPNPRWPQPNRADWIQGTALTLRPVGVVQAPLRPIDWPNPRGLLPANAGFAAAINLGLLRPGVNPEINYDWPNPQRARQPVADWIQSAFIALQTSPPPPRPFNQTDWPVPRGAVGVHVGSTSATQLGLLRPDINPFLPRDFANPRAPLRSIDLYGWVCALSALVIPQPPNPPIRQYDWPNPPAPVRGIDLWGWSQPVTVLNLPPTIIPPPEVLQPGGRGVPHTFSRKKWRELQMLIAAEMAAVAKAEELTKRGKREALLQAARAAAAAVDAAEAEGENKRLDKLLVRNALTLRAATRAASEVKLLRETASAIEQSRAIVQRQQDEEDEMINLLMLS